MLGQHLIHAGDTAPVEEIVAHLALQVGRLLLVNGADTEQAVDAILQPLAVVEEHRHLAPRVARPLGRGHPDDALLGI